MQQQILEVEVIIPQNVLEENESLKRMYNPEKKQFAFKLAPETTKELKESITEIIQTSEVKDLVLMNPMFQALGFVQNFKALKYNAETPNDAEYEQAVKIIGKFNSSFKKASDEIKAPKVAYNKKINAFGKMIADEITGIKNYLEKEFKPYLDEKQRKKDEAQAKKDKALTDKIDQLTEENKKNNDLLLNQKKQGRILEINNIINSIVKVATDKINGLNIAGLEAMKTYFLDKKIGELSTPEVIFTPEEETAFRQEYAREILKATALIDDKIEQINGKETIKELKAENDVFNAANSAKEVPLTPEETIPVSEVPTPPVPPAPPVSSTDTVPPPPPPHGDDLSESLTDSEKFTIMETMLVNLTKEIEKTKSNIEALNFSDRTIKEIRAKVAGTALHNVLDLATKTSNWITTCKGKYEESLKNNNN